MSSGEVLGSGHTRDILWVFPHTEHSGFLRQLTQIIGISIGAPQLRFLHRPSGGNVQ